MDPLLPPPDRHLDPRRRQGLRIGLVLLLVASIPVAGIGGLTYHGVRTARSEVQGAGRVEELALEAVRLTNLDGAVSDELVWSAIDQVSDSIDAPETMIEAFLGSDPTDEVAAATDRTDQLLAELNAPSIESAIRAARVDGLDRRQVVSRYVEVTTTVHLALRTVMIELAAAPHRANGEFPTALQLLRLAVEARAAVSDEFNAYFATIFDLRDAPPVELARLVHARAVFDERIASLRAYGSGIPGLVSALDDVETSAGTATFSGAIDDLIATSLHDGLPDVSATLTIDMLSDHLDTFTTTYRAAAESSDATIGLLDATAGAVLDAASEDKAAADGDIDVWYVLAVALALATAASVLLASRYIIRPLKELRRAAVDLRSGELEATCTLAGPTEVRTAALAIHDAASHVQLVTRQVGALAAGDLDADVLDEPAPGGLGVAVQYAVTTLRSALAQQEDFRRRLAHEASHDGLTNLPNRSASLAQLTRSLARTSRAGAQVAVLFVDLDQFNIVNDHHGHQSGDAVLATIARRIVTMVREGDHVGRLGGDEFVVVAEPVTGIDEAFALAERIVAAIGEPIELPSGAVTISASVGIAVADGLLTADELIRDADLAVYRAKAAGRGGIEVCNEDLHAQVAETADLTIALRNAIDHDELVLHFQPIIDVPTGRLHALEALVRWRRPGFPGLVPPDLFIGLAERSNLIVDLDRWVIAAVARQIAEWNDDVDLDVVPVAVNVSRRHLAHDHFVDHVLDPLAANQVAWDSVIVEITESALVDDLASAAMKLQRLRDHGILVSIDDFGTGYTSLAHLRSLPVDILKIDRSFTASAMSSGHDASIVKLIIDTGHLLGATITSEGIETEAEADQLIALGSDHLQGYYFCRPVPADEIRFDQKRDRVVG